MMDLVKSSQQSVNHQSVNMTSLEKNIGDIIRKGDRTFGYKLDEKTAKSKLLKGTQKVSFEVTEKQNCSNIDFNTLFSTTFESCGGVYTSYLSW